MVRRRFTREFTLKTAWLIKERGASCAQAARDLGLHQSHLRDWTRKFADDTASPFLGTGR
jgi:transposase-like protein